VFRLHNFFGFLIWKWRVLVDSEILEETDRQSTDSETDEILIFDLNAIGDHW